MARKMATFVAALLMSGGAVAGTQAWAQTNGQNGGSDDSKSSQSSQPQSVPYGFAGGYQETDRDKLGFPDRPNRQRMRAAGSRYRDNWRDDSEQDQGRSSASRRWSNDNWANRDVWDDSYSLYDRNTSDARKHGARKDWSDRQGDDDQNMDNRSSRSWNSQQGGSSKQSSSSQKSSSSQQGRGSASTDRSRLTSALRRAGFTDVRVLDAAYLVRARTQDGDTILMYINPPTRSSSSNASQADQPSSGSPSWQRDRDAQSSQSND